MQKVYDKDGYSVRWNESSTFNIYLDGTEVDVWTEYNVNDIEDAKDAAAEHMKEWLHDAKEGHWYTR
jgi:hypothetical protein